MSILFSQNLSKNNEIAPQEADFTEVLASIAVTPKMLYFYGKMPENRLKKGCKKVKERPKTVAIVGSRKPTKYGETIAYKLAYEAAQRGAVVVSGLAYGIDSVAHRAALDAGGETVAVLGTPIDQIYPRPHQPLAAEIVEKGGCVMSELPPGVQIGDEYLVRVQTEEGERLTKVKYHPKTCFLHRNRLIAGLADVVVIPEAAERSGSLNTAAHALEQGREIFAVPGDITRPLSQGCNQLIRQGATPLLGINDVLEVLFPPVRRKKLAQAELLLRESGALDEIVLKDASSGGLDKALSGAQGAEMAILRCLAAGLDDGTEICRRAGLSVAEFNQNITLLEIKGQVVALGANRWMLK